MTNSMITQDERAELEQLRAAREKLRQYQMARRKSRRSAGLCLDCDLPAVNGKALCKKHRRARSDYETRRRANAPRCPHCGSAISKIKAAELSKTKLKTKGDKVL